MQITKRPRYLNLFQIRLPLPGFVSILHRASGVLMILGIPLSLLALDCAISSPGGYQAVASLFANPIVKLISFGFIWSLCHHLCAGIRFLLIEIHIGTELPAARLSSALVMVISLVLTAALSYLALAS